MRAIASFDEIDHSFVRVGSCEEITSAVALAQKTIRKNEETSDLLLGDLLDLNVDDRAFIDREIMPRWDSRGTANWFVYSSADLLQYLVGLAYGRWDIRVALDPSLAPVLADPFDPLPVCPPGMLVGPNGLPAEPDCIASVEWLHARPNSRSVPPRGTIGSPIIPDAEYPLRVAWDGLLVDDPGFNGAQPHRDDIVRRIRKVLDILWKDKAHAFEQKTCDVLGITDLRDHFRKASGFFQHHLKRYSKEPPQSADLLAALDRASGSYTIWLYYHRLTDQTLYAVVNNHVEPKINDTFASNRAAGGKR